MDVICPISSTKASLWIYIKMYVSILRYRYIRITITTFHFLHTVGNGKLTTIGIDTIDICLYIYSLI